MDLCPLGCVINTLLFNSLYLKARATLSKFEKERFRSADCISLYAVSLAKQLLRSLE